MVTGTRRAPLHGAGDLDALVEHHFAVERAMHRALGGYHHEPVDLLLAQALREANHERETRRTAALGGRVLAVHLDGADVPALAVGVHLEGDGGARRERDREVLLRTGCRVVTPGFTRLVRVHDVVADPEVMLVGAGAATPRSGFHFRPRGGVGLDHIVLPAASRPAGAYSSSSGLNSSPVGTLGWKNVDFG